MITVLEVQLGVGWVRGRVVVVLNGTREGISPSILSSYKAVQVRAATGSAAPAGPWGGLSESMWTRLVDSSARSTTSMPVPHRVNTWMTVPVSSSAGDGIFSRMWGAGEWLSGG